MPPAPPDINPSRQVERIREILVGRQMDSVERRLERLEANLRPMPTQAPDDVFEIRLASYEQRHDLKLQELRDEIDAEKARRVEETHRLASQIQAAARSREASGLEAQVELEERITRWLEHWNQGFRQYLHQREQHLISEMRSELDQTRKWVESRLSTSDESRVGRMQASFAQLADAARAIADAAAAQAARTGGAP
jgi:flagellar biosynthesis/type III secretory pathway protein FliH